MKKEKKDKNFIHKPTFPGGNKAFSNFVKQNLQYPKEALSHRIEGVVRIRYEIDYKGIVINTKIVSSLGYGCDEEADRIIRLLKFEVPKNHGVKVSFFKTTNIHFKLPKPKARSFSYSVATATREGDKKRDSGSGYSYSITIQ